MKPITFSLIAFALANGLASAQTAYTTPVGYETITLAPNQFNIMGARLFNPILYSGIFESSTSTTLVDDQATFSLNATTEYIIESVNGGTITTLGSNFSGTTISGLAGVTGSFVSAYVIREAKTVSDVFGANNESGLAASPNADPTEADIIFIPNGASFTRVFYSTFTDDPNFTGWLDADTFDKIPNEVIDPSVGIYVQTANSLSPIELLVTGVVKLTPTAYTASSDFSLIGGVYPAGSTLATTGMSSFVQPSPNADPTEADVVLLPQSSGFVRAFFSTFADDPAFAGWLDADTFNQIPDEAITSGFLIQKIGPNFTGLHSVPPSYSSL